MLHGFCVLLLLLATARSARGTSLPTPAPYVPQNTRGDPPVTCWIVRTYYGHGDSRGDGSLRQIIKQLQGQTSRRWVALMVVMDSHPFQELRYILRDVADDRISVFAEWVGEDYTAYEGLSWRPYFHVKLHKATDEAIRACPPNTEMVVVTNADNRYDSNFLEEVESAAAAGADLVAFDFYSRYQRQTAEPCKRLEWSEGAPPCKENEAMICQTDFAANAYRWRRLLAEDRLFEPVAAEVPWQGTGEVTVGLVSARMVEEGWKLHRVAGCCLVSHGHSPQQCALRPGAWAWDDSQLFSDESRGGECVEMDEAVRKATMKPQQLELVLVNLTYDPDSELFRDRKEGEREVRLGCLRTSQPRQWLRHMYAFGRVCAARGDVAALPADLPVHPWDALMGEAQAAHWGLNGSGVDGTKTGVGLGVANETKGNEAKGEGQAVSGLGAGAAGDAAAGAAPDGVERAQGAGKQVCNKADPPLDVDDAQTRGS